MREILFRAQAINREEGREYRTNYENSDWVYGLLTRHEDVWDCAKMTNEDGISNIDVAEQTLGQYTGITDKNGTKIFEGDIAKIFGMVGKIICECGAFGIAFDDCIDYKKLDNFTEKRIGNNFSGVCCDNFISLYEIYWNLNNLDECLHEVEVIGNIYDNPELLKGE